MADKSDEVKATEEKQTNKTYTQSEADQLVAKILKQELGKYADYSDVKAEAETLKREKSERELAEKSEIEKAQLVAKDWQDKYGKLESEYKQQKLVNVKNEVLSDKKYAALPKVYRDSVRMSENADEIKSHADEMLKQFTADVATVKPTIGAPGSSPTPTEPVKAKSLAEILKERASRR